MPNSKNSRLRKAALALNIAEFEKARDALEAASERLDRSVESSLTECGDDESALHDLVDELPRGYDNTRRVHEKILRLRTTQQHAKDALKTPTPEPHVSPRPSMDPRRR